MTLRLRRGTDAERQTLIFDEGELVFVTDYQSAGSSPLWIGDGSTLGGLAVAGELEVSLSSLLTDLDLSGNDITGTGNISITGNVTATTITGNFVGDGSGITNLPTSELPPGFVIDCGLYD